MQTHRTGQLVVAGLEMAIHGEGRSGGVGDQGLASGGPGREKAKKKHEERRRWNMQREREGGKGSEN